MEICIDPHPLLDTVILHTIWPNTLDQISTLSDLDARFSEDAQPPMDRPEEVKPTIRDLLRHGGFKPSGRSKPASEYLVGAAEKGRMGSINAAVDCCNVASLHSGLPISVVDIERGHGAWRIGLVPPNTEYIFNPAGQVISIGGLLSLFDGEGPCGGPVKDSQRTKTHEKTRQTLSIIWGSVALPGRTETTAEWYASLMESLGARVQRLKPTAP
jgi:DNA/RNA-binding domain of Phe-tRNA-synthetase-like protein